jgi:hypothetical protein
VARRRVVGHTGAAGNLTQAEARDTVLVEDLDRASEQPASRVRRLGNEHVDSVHTSVDSVNTFSRPFSPPCSSLR